MKSRLLQLISVVFLFAFCQQAKAQNPTDSLPPDPGGFNVVVSNVQGLAFGGFSTIGSGSITLSNTSTRSASGGIVLLNLGQTFHPAIFQIEAPEGTIITIMNGPDATLTGSNGGTMSLALGACSPASPFTITSQPPATTPVTIGGTLSVSGPSPPGTYSGSFNIIVNYQ